MISTHRLIPCLLIQAGKLVKTIKFKSPTYLGDPLNAIKIFSDKEADEIIILDIDATPRKRCPEFEFLRDLAGQAFMPVAYGGGVSSLSQIETLFSLGIEKVILDTSGHKNQSLVQQAANRFGSQSIVVCLDCRKSFLSASYSVYTKGGKRKVSSSVIEEARKFESLGAGELVLNNIDRDGTMAGYDHSLLKLVTCSLSIPVIALGGANSLYDMQRAIDESGASAAAAGSLFSFRWPERAVLINYPKNRYQKSDVHAA